MRRLAMAAMGAATAFCGRVLPLFYIHGWQLLFGPLGAMISRAIANGDPGKHPADVENRRRRRAARRSIWGAFRCGPVQRQRTAGQQQGHFGVCNDICCPPKCPLISPILLLISFSTRLQRNRRRKCLGYVPKTEMRRPDCIVLALCRPSLNSGT